jgi:hypothetical protein
MKAKALVLFSIMFFAGVFAGACSDVAAIGNTEGPSCPECHECHCKLAVSKPSYFSGEGCPAGDWLMQGHQNVQLPNKAVVPGVRCVKIEHECGCNGPHDADR